MKTSGSDVPAATYEAVEEFTPSAGSLGAYAGDFKSDELGVIYRLRQVQGKLQLVEISDFGGIPRTGIPVPDVLRPTIADEFELSSQASTIRFPKNVGTDVTGFKLDGAGTHDIEFQRTAELGNRPTTF